MLTIDNKKSVAVCPKCNGLKKIGDMVCPTCNGEGVVWELKKESKEGDYFTK